MIAADGGDHEDGVRLLRVQGAVRHVGDREVLDRLAALQLEVADFVLLVARLIGAVGQRGGGVEHQGGEADGEREASMHASPPVATRGQAARRSKRRATSDIE
jgi:hypothetical protein